MTGSRLAPGRTAFLDRDGTINTAAAEGDYVDDPDYVSLLPGAAEAINRLNRRGNPVVVVTNQRGISLGLMSEADLEAVNRRLIELLAAGGAKLDAIYYCPHAAGSCDCRKPGPGMFLRAERELPGVSIGGGAMVGDSALDIEAGDRLGLTTVRIGPEAPGEIAADRVTGNLLEGVDWLLAPGDA